MAKSDARPRNYASRCSESETEKGEDDGDGIVSAVCEVAKYTVKASDYVLPTDWELSCETVATLDRALVNEGWLHLVV